MRGALVAFVVAAGCSSPPPPAAAPEPAPVIDIGGEAKPMIMLAPEETAPPSASEALLDPSKATLRAPPVFRARFDTTKGSFVLEAHRQWAPHGVDRLYNLVAMGYYSDISIFRVVTGFVVQFGIHGDPAVNSVWKEATIQPDEVSQSNLRGFVSFAQAASPDSRNVQLFVNLADNARLDGLGFAPVARVVEGIDVVESFHAGYGDRPTREQGRMQEEGNVFVRETFPELDFIVKAELIEG